MQVIFEFLTLPEVITLQQLNKRCYRRIVPHAMQRSLFVRDHFDVSVLERLKCGNRILLFGMVPKKLYACSLASNYS